MYKYIYLLSFLTVILACSKGSDDNKLPTVNRTITRAQTYYDLKIYELAKFMEEDSMLLFVDSLNNHINSVSWEIECNWDQDRGIITFSSENPGSSPYPTATIIYNLSTGTSVVGDVEDSKYSYFTMEVGISLQDVLIGSASELNARTYISPYLTRNYPMLLYVREIGSNYIEGWIEGPASRRIFDQSGFTGESVLAEVRCDFRICTGC